MAYKKLYNPTNTEIALFVGSVSVAVPPRGIFVGEEEVVNVAHQMSARLELTSATDDDFQAFANPSKVSIPKKEKKLKGAKK